MDVMSIEHSFGNEHRTAIKQLFMFFCNNISLGQWEAAKACIGQLISNTDILSMDFTQLLMDIISNPMCYCEGSDTLKSPYHLSLIMYNYCCNYGQQTLSTFKSEPNLYTEILIKFLILTNIDEDADDAWKDNEQQLAHEFLNLNFSNMDKRFNLLYYKKLLTRLLLKAPVKFRKLYELLVCLSDTMRADFLHIHLAAIEVETKSFADFCSTQLSMQNVEENMAYRNLSKLFSLLFIYKTRADDSSEIGLFKDTFDKILSIFYKSFPNSSTNTDTIDTRETLLAKLCSALLHIDENEYENRDPISPTVLDIFLRLQYNFTTGEITKKYEAYPLFALVKEYYLVSSQGNKKTNICWKYLFLYSYFEKKDLIRCLIDECQIMVENNNFDYLTQILNLKEFQNLKPLILLIGITKVKDMHGLKRLIACLCMNSIKGSLVDKLGNLFKTHLDFIQWFQNLSSDKRTKDIAFVDLVKMLHRKLPLNIIYESIDIHKLDYDEIMKILKNTLIDIEISGKTKWVRFVDEINEKISLVQDACLHVYNGFYCINKTVEAIIYCCENINKKIYKVQEANDVLNSQQKLSRSATIFLAKSESGPASQNDQDSLQAEYKDNVLANLDIVRKIITQLKSFNYRLELLENLYSLVFLMSTHIKEDEEDGEMDNTTNLDTEKRNSLSYQDPVDYDGTDHDNPHYLNVLNTLLAQQQHDDKSNEYVEVPSIYTNAKSSTDNGPPVFKLRTQRTTSNGSMGSNSSSYIYLQNDVNNKSAAINMTLRRNAGGGGSFLLNDFLCRDLLHLLKDLVADLKQTSQNFEFALDSTTTASHQYLCCSIKTKADYTMRLMRLQHLINETIWRFHIVKHDSIPNDYGKIVYFADVFDINTNDELLTSLIIRNQMNSDQRKTSNASARIRANSANTQNSSNGHVTPFVHNNPYRCLTTSSGSSKRRTNAIVMKLLADTDSLCVLCLKESRTNEANQLLKLKYNSNNGTKNTTKQFAFEQIKYFVEHEQALNDIEYLNNTHASSDTTVLSDLVLIKLFKVVDRLIENEDDPLHKTILLADFLIISQTNVNIAKHIVDYTLKKLEEIGKYANDDDNQSQIRDKLHVFLKNAELLLDNVANMNNFSKFLTKLNSLGVCTRDLATDSDDFLGSMAKYKDLNESLNELKSNFDLSQANQNQNKIYLDLVNFINDSLGNTNLISKFYMNDKSLIENTESGYLSSFYGYCKTLFEYFLNKQQSDNNQSYFTLLTSSPASLICKLLFENSLKPLLLEELTDKLNLNLTVILLHNSCPRLKLTNKQHTHSHHQQKDNINSQVQAQSQELQIQVNNNDNDDDDVDDNEQVHDSDEYFRNYDTRNFYTVLNKNDIPCCSTKKPHVLIYNLLLKLLNYCKTFLQKSHAMTDQGQRQLNNTDNANKLQSGNNNLIRLDILYEMYDCAELKSILNEAQELQHIDLASMETNEEKLSFFINLHNLLTIHAYVSFASVQRYSLKNASDGRHNANTHSVNNKPDCLFHNNTEKILLQQRMCYKIGQMGIVSLFDLKYLILNCCQKLTRSTTDDNLLKYGLYDLDLDIEPLWCKFLPRTTESNAKILFALINCCESDQPICLFDSEAQLFRDQLNVHMNLFLNQNIFCDLKDGVLYLPALIVDNIYLFNSTTKQTKSANQQENMLNFLLENLSKPLNDKLKQLIETYSAYGENIDEYGCKELGFKICKLNESRNFLIKLDYANTSDYEGWYRSQMKMQIKFNENLIETNEHEKDVDCDFLFQSKQLASDCLEYINTKSPLVAQSLGFLFNDTKRNEFFDDLLTSLSGQQNALNRFIQLYVPLDYLTHLNMNMKLNFIIKFLLIANYQQTSNDETKIELIIFLANYFANKHQWDLVLNLLSNFTLDDSKNGTNGQDIFDGFIQTQLDGQLACSTANRQQDFVNNSKFSYKDLYNLYDFACICSACKDATINERSYFNLFKIKNFLKQLRACLSLLYLWPIDGCLEIIDFCINKLNTYDINAYYIELLNEKRIEFEAYKVLTQCAKKKLEKYFDEQTADEANVNANKATKKICQICLTWQTAKRKLETCAKSNDYDTINSIIDLLVDQEEYTNAKYLCKKYELNADTRFHLDYLHLKSILLNIKCSTVITLIDFNQYMTNKQCLTFNANNPFNICFKLLNELKCLSSANNTVIVLLCQYLLNNFTQPILDHDTVKSLKILELTSKVYNMLLQEHIKHFDAYKRHYENPLAIIEQLLMNSKIDLCSKVIRLCREFMLPPMSATTTFANAINSLLVTYAKKALEFRVYTTTAVANNPNMLITSFYSNNSQINDDDQLGAGVKRKSPSFKDYMSLKKTNPFNSTPRMSIDVTSVTATQLLMSSSHKPRGSIDISGSSPLLSSSLKSKSTYLTPPNTSQSASYSSTGFLMPLVAPTKDQWIRDDTVNECMACNNVTFTIINRRHHCRRCGRVVCSSCSQYLTMIGDVLQRTCIDCYRQSEALGLLNVVGDNKTQRHNGVNNDKNLDLTRRLHKSMKLDGGSGGSSESSSRQRKASQLIEMKIDEQHAYWELSNDADEDRETRDKFRYQQAPSTSLCLSILDLHDDPLECGKELLQMCDELSGYLQTTANQNKQNKNEDFALILNMIKYLLCNAKVKLISQNSSTTMISLCDTYLSLIDILEELLIANCSNIPSLNDLRNQETTRRLRNRLLEEERHDLAMNLSTKCGLDAQTVWASWGLIELKRGNFKDARAKFEKCLKIVTNKHQSITQSQLKILNDIISYFEQAPPIRLSSYCTDESNMDDLQLKESIYYLDTYGNYYLIVSFYQRHGYLQKSLQCLLDNKCNSDVFVDAVLTPCLRTGEFHQLLDYMYLLDRSQQRFHSYLIAIGKYLEKNGYLNTLYEFQLFMKDYVRAAMSCIHFFAKNGENYASLGKNLVHLNKAREHLEKYLETCSSRNTSHTVHGQLTWKQQKIEQQSLCKQMAPQDVDSYLNAISLQIEVTKFLNNCKNVEKLDNMRTNLVPTLFGSNDTKTNLCCLILLSGDTVQDGFGSVVRIVQCFNLNPTLVYSQTARELAKQYNFKEIHILLKCINESGYNEDLNSAHDECISAFIRVFSSSTTATASNDPVVTTSANQQYNKEIEELIQSIKDEQNKINAYVLTGRLKSAYLIAIKLDNKDIVKHIAMVAERMGQNLIKDICNKWLEKYTAK